MERTNWADPQRMDDLVQSLRDRLERQPLRKPETEASAGVSVSVGQGYKGPVFVGVDPFVSPSSLPQPETHQVVPLKEYLALQKRYEDVLTAARWRWKGWWVAGILLMVVLVMALK